MIRLTLIGESNIFDDMRWLPLFLLLLLTSLVASAADISGTWKGTAESANGTLERTFVFKVDGAKLTGETSSEMLGKSVIQDGKVMGDTLSFSIKANFQGEEMKLEYKGKLTGDVMKLSVEIPALNQTVEYTAKKVS